MERVLTVGHGTLAATGFADLLRAAGVDLVADVRSYPGSRRHPHFGRAMGDWLAGAGIAYAWLPALGGRRRLMAASPNVGLRNPQFRAYADHMATVEFAAGVGELRALAADRTVAAMCAESLWWRCHRRLLADHLVLVEGMAVEHLHHDGRCGRHVPTAEARRDGTRVAYDLYTQQALADG